MPDSPPPVPRPDRGGRFLAPEGWLWGVASSAFQSEGFARADGKGPSVWDHWLGDLRLAGPGVDGAVATRSYDRDVYRADMALLRAATGANAYRFSVSWPRVMPEGVGEANERSLAHYRRVALDAREAGMEPLPTLYHWDLPLALHRRGGWASRESVGWFAAYAAACHRALGDVAPRVVLLNEPLVETALGLRCEALAEGREPGPEASPPAEAAFGRSLREYNHKLLAAAAAARAWRGAGYAGALGLALALGPCLPADPASAADAAAARLADGVVNRFFLDALLRGSYPADVLDRARALGAAGEHGIGDGDAEAVGAAGLGGGPGGFVGVNYYAPGWYRHDPSATGRHLVSEFDPPGEELALNGACRPDMLLALLRRLRDEYGNPPVLVTENGAAFDDPEEERVRADGTVNDARRCRYLAAHALAALEAAREGCGVRGYFAWAGLDNLEWLRGAEGARYGLVRVDFATQARTPKRSAAVYAAIARGEEPPPGLAA